MSNDREAQSSQAPSETERVVRHLDDDDMGPASGHRIRIATLTSCGILGLVAVVTLFAVMTNPASPPQWAVNLVTLIVSGAIAFLFSDKSFRGGRN